MFKQISLRTKILLILACLMALTLGDCAITVWLISRMGAIVTSVMNTNVAALKTAQEMETSLALQKGLLTYYFMDGDSEWLDQLERRRRDFRSWLKSSRESAQEARQSEILDEVEARYNRYSHDQDQIIELYKAGDREGGFKRHQEIRKNFLEILDLCDRYKRLHERIIALAREDIDSQGRIVNSVAVVVLPVAVLLGVMLVYILIGQILEPIRQLAVGRDGDGEDTRVVNEVKALSRRVSSLIEDVDEKQTQLELSREHLLQAEKLAMVGKLAAGVAHTIRNPLTSVKMRLFSMERSLDLSSTEKEDFEVISEEIRHIDTIVQNFLEFSRPPKLKMQSISPSDVVDMAIQLLKHRLESYGVTLELYRQRELSKIQGDPEQLKEVLVNLIINACEAMGEGGRIEIREEEGTAGGMGHVAVLRVIDYGPGMPESVKDKVFQPFFSTKEEGTGLGLSIAARIIEDHKGCLNLRSREGKGTTFTITLPCMEDGAWLRS